MHDGTDAATPTTTGTIPVHKAIASVAVIPEGAGPVKPTGLVVVTGSSCFPAGCGYTSSRVRGQGSTEGRPAQRAWS
jgi:hypothetical protein